MGINASRNKLCWCGSGIKYKKCHLNRDSQVEISEEDKFKLLKSLKGVGLDINLGGKVLNAADYGVPQSRERVIFIGIKKSALSTEAIEELSKSELSEAYNPYPKPSHAFTLKDENLKPAVQLASVFEKFTQ